MRMCMQLFFSFLQIGLFSIGGGYATIPLIQDQVVARQGWLNLQEFTDIITISQMTPGPLAVNTSTFTGIRIAGLWGAVLATIGCVLSGYVISIAMYRFFEINRKAAWVSGLLAGLRAASVGLILSAAATILTLALHGEQGGMNGRAVLLFASALLILRRLKWNPILVMALTGAAGAAVYW